jgi:hypothetical protein
MVKQQFLERFVNKQFDMIGAPISFKDIRDNPNVGITGAKQIPWWRVYRFESEAQYQEWRQWGEAELERMGFLDPWREMNNIDMAYGMEYKWAR